jgi:hypothetical protein
MYDFDEKDRRNMILVRKPEGKRSPGNPKCRWKDNIKMNIREIEWGGIDWIDLVQDSDLWRALVNKVMSPLAPLNFRKYLSG